jgi:predicted lipoprotein with Yx(FWY)xxD motif
MSRRHIFVVSVALIVAIAACLGTASGATRGAKVGIRATALGTVVVDAHKRTLYLFAKDTPRKSACYGGCAATWSPLLTTGTPVAGPGAKAGLLGTITRKDAKKQVTYAGHPLYLYAGDTGAGQTTGQGAGGLWFALSPAGKKIKKAPASSDPGGNGGASPPPPPPPPPPTDDSDPPRY